jgi:hypothetical protein
METVALLLKAASCEALPSVPEEIEEALECQQALKGEGITNVQRQWLAQLVSTRRIVVVPTPNALGFCRGIREESDFPFDLPDLDSDLCMQTIASRTLNELFREDIFQFCFYFHGGVELIGYTWGNDSYMHTPISPNHECRTNLQAHSRITVVAGMSTHSNSRVP